MLILNKKTGYSSKRNYVEGRGFVDSLSSTLKNVGSYISQNKDLIAKPLLGATGDLAAFGLTEAGKSIITHIINKKRKSNSNSNSNSNSVESTLSPKSIQILQSIMSNDTPEFQQSIPVENIIGSGIKRF